MTSNYKKNQENARKRRDFTLRLIRREAKIHGNQDTVYPKTAAKEATRGSEEAEMGSIGDAPTVRQDGHGD